MNCKDCKHWTERWINHTRQMYTSGDQIGQEFDADIHQSASEPHYKNTECVSNTKEYIGRGDCDHPKMQCTEDSDGAFLDCGHDGDIHFGKDFGCIHFTPRS